MGKIHPDDLEKMKRKISEGHKNFAINSMEEGHDVVPANVEPGFEDRYKRKSRYRNNAIL